MTDQVVAIITDLNRFTRGEIVRLAVNVDANLRDSPPVGTPIDTGWARANWVPSLGAPTFLEQPKEIEPGMVAARAQVQERGLNEVLEWDRDDGPIFITNSVPYIEALNEGWSTQSPAGFVQDAITKAVSETYSAGANKAARGRRAAAARARKARPK